MTWSKFLRMQMQWMTYGSTEPKSPQAAVQAPSVNSAAQPWSSHRKIEIGCAVTCQSGCEPSGDPTGSMSTSLSSTRQPSPDRRWSVTIPAVRVAQIFVTGVPSAKWSWKRFV
jgi:hypothetical protein